MNSETYTTPVMQQYWELKKQVPDCLLFFRLGDFYELFSEDAKIASQILNITLTSRDKNKENPIPMAGVPHHAASGYIQRLLNAGKKVALSEQIEDASAKIVPRKIVRILTPALPLEHTASEAHYLASLIPHGDSHGIFACLEPSTGELLISSPLNFQEIQEQLYQGSIRHLLKDASMHFNFPNTCLTETLPPEFLTFDQAYELLKTHYAPQNDIVFLKSFSSSKILAAGYLIAYVLKTQQQTRLAHLRLPEPLHRPKSLHLSALTASHLDLNDLFRFLQRTQTALGSRQLKRWLFTTGLTCPHAIAERQSTLQILATLSVQDQQHIKQSLSQIADLERICGRLHASLIHPRDTLALGKSLAQLPTLLAALKDLTSLPNLLSHLIEKIRHEKENLENLSQRILTTQQEDPPLSSQEGGIFKLGTDPQLDHLIDLTTNGQRWLIQLETQERAQTGISSLKIKYNRIAGYFIEITQAQIKNVPLHYQRKQTLVGTERFLTPELKTFEEEMLTALEKQKTLEHHLFQDLLNRLRESTESIMQLAQTLGEFDALFALMSLTSFPGWTFPTIDLSLELTIQEGRHPLLDQIQKGHFVPNSLSLSSPSHPVMLITGPNMGGKSTLMRQTALILLLGQLGAPVPAKKAHWGVVSGIFTRIGAQDAITQGHSTFMVEMTELAQILHQADERAFLILDEIGRGTSTEDGSSIAWATLEWICDTLRARTLFATHYHELTEKEGKGLKNYHMAVDLELKELIPQLRFLYELRSGPSQESFGIHVAQLAGIPQPILQRAQALLHSKHPQKTSLLPRQPTEDPRTTKILQEIRKFSVENSTPLKALHWIAELQKLLE